MRTAAARRLRAAITAIAGASRDLLYLAGLGAVALGMSTFHPGLGWVALGAGLIWAAGAGIRRR